MTPAIELRWLRKAFGDHVVLDGVDLVVEPGEKVCVIGPSGSGKSTLLRCVNRLEEPTGGHVFVEGVEVTDPDCDIDEVRTRIGMVFQHFNLFPHLDRAGQPHHRAADRAASVEGGGHRHRRARCWPGSGSSEKETAYPAQLSGGQQQRVAIARALCMEPDMMLFDEVTSALDPELVGDVLQVMRDLAARAMTMLVVTHEMAFARDVADRVVFLDEGQIVEEGPPAQVLGAPTHERTRRFLERVINP